MDRNDEALSTRDLVATRDPQAGAAVSSQGAAQTNSQTEAPPAGSPSLEKEPTRPLETDTDGATGRSAQDGDRGATGRSAQDGDRESLLSTESTADFQTRWEAIQTRFVDDPRRAVEDADGLVAMIMQQLAEGFAQERDRLEGQWSRGEDISTEDLRVALQRYRSFFHRLLST